jgi:hypothetical protein
MQIIRSLLARVAELVDATDLKSVEVYPRAGSIPASGTTLIHLYIFINKNLL